MNKMMRNGDARSSSRGLVPRWFAQLGFVAVIAAALLSAACAGSDTGTVSSESASEANASDTDAATEDDVAEDDAAETTDATATPVEPTATPTIEPTPELEKPVTQEWEYDGIVQSYYRTLEDKDLVLFVAYVDGQRHDVAVDIESGEEVWRYPSTRGGVYDGYGPVYPPVTGNTYATLVEDPSEANRVRVQALDLTTGEELWTSDTIFVTNYPTVCEDGIICVVDRTNADAPVQVRFDSSTGEVVEIPPPGAEPTETASTSEASDDDASGDSDATDAATPEADADVDNDEDADDEAEAEATADEGDGETPAASADSDSAEEAADSVAENDEANSPDKITLEQYPTDRWVRTRPDGTEVWAVSGEEAHGPEAASRFGFGSDVDKEAGVVVVSLGTRSESYDDLVLAGLDFDTGEVIWRSSGRRPFGRSVQPLKNPPINVRVKTSGTSQHIDKSGGGIAFENFLNYTETIEIFDIKTGETQVAVEVVPYTDWELDSGADFNEPRSALLDGDLVVLSADGPMRVDPAGETIEPVEPETIGWCQGQFDLDLREEVGVINQGYSPCAVGDLKKIENPDRLPTVIEAPIGQVIDDLAVIVSEAKLRVYRYETSDSGE